MGFHFKADLSDTRCHGCVHAHIIKPHRTNENVIMCQMLHMAVGPIKECNQFLPHIHAPIPMHFILQAWTLEGKNDKGQHKTIGFKAPSPLLTQALQQLEGTLEENED